MAEIKHKHKNALAIYRRRMKFAQKQVAHMLGHRDTSMVSRYEHGRSFPPLVTALRLEVIYRVPVAFLYPNLYRELKEQMRTRETLLKQPSQGVLF